MARTQVPAFRENDEITWEGAEPSPEGSPLLRSRLEAEASTRDPRLLHYAPRGYIVSSMANRAKRQALQIVKEAFVADERKAEVRKRLARLKGQVAGIKRMLDQNRPCIEILTQIAAAQEAVRGTGRVMARNYLERCASAGIKAAREQEVYDEVMDVIFKLTR